MSLYITTIYKHSIGKLACSQRQLLYFGCRKSELSRSYLTNSESIIEGSAPVVLFLCGCAIRTWVGLLGWNGEFCTLFLPKILLEVRSDNWCG